MELNEQTTTGVLLTLETGITVEGACVQATHLLRRKAKRDKANREFLLQQAESYENAGREVSRALDRAGR